MSNKHLVTDCQVINDLQSRLHDAKADLETECEKRTPEVEAKEVIIAELNTAGVAVKDGLGREYIGLAYQKLALDYKNVRYCIDLYTRRNNQAPSGIGFYIKNYN